MTFGTWRWCGCQPQAPAGFNLRKCSWFSSSLWAESIPGPWYGWKEYVTEKSSDTTGNQSRDRPTSSAAPWPLRHPRPPASAYYHYHYSGYCIDKNAQKPTVNAGHVTPDNIKWIFSFSFRIKFLVLKIHSCVYKIQRLPSASSFRFFHVDQCYRTIQIHYTMIKEAVS